MSQAVAKKKTPSGASTKKANTPPPSEAALSAAVNETAADLKQALIGFGEVEKETNRACEDISQMIINGLQQKLNEANVDQDKSEKLMADICAERERLFQLNADVRETNDKRLKLFLEYIFKAVKVAGGIVILKLVLDFVLELIKSYTKK